MPDPITQAGAVHDQTRYAALGMGARQFTGLWTQRSPYRDAAVEYLISKYYGGSRFDSILDGINREISVRLTDVRRPGSIVFNNNACPPAYSFSTWKYVQNSAQVVRTIEDGKNGTIYDITPGQLTPLMTKSAGATRARFLSLNTQLFVTDGIAPKKIMQSAKTWKPNMVYNVGDFIIDPAGNIQKIQSNPVTYALTNSEVIDAAVPFVNFGIGGSKYTVLTVAGNPAIPQQQTATFAGLTHIPSLNGQTIPWSPYQDAVANLLNLTANQIAFRLGTVTANAAETGTMIALQATPGTSGGTAPTFSATPGHVTNDGGMNGGINWTCFGSAVQDWGLAGPVISSQPNYIGEPVIIPGPSLQYWRPNHRVANFDYLLDPDGNVQVTNPGSSVWFAAAMPPNRWSAAIGTPTITGTAIYFNYGPIGSWFAGATFGGGSTGVNNPCCILDTNGNLQIVQDVTAALVAGSTVPTWATTTGSTTTDGGLTWVCLAPGAILWSGDIQWSYSFHSIDGSVSNPSGATTVANGGFGASGMFAFALEGDNTTNLQCDQIWIWRTAQGQATPVLAGIIPNPAIGTATTWSFLDVFGSDNQLNAQIPAPTQTTANPPPTNITAPVFYLKRIFAIVDNTVVWSTGPDTVTGNGNTSFAPLNFIPFTAQPIRLVPVTVQGGGLLVFTTSGIQIILGLGVAGSNFYATNYYDKVSISGYDAVDTSNNAVFLMESNRKVSTVAIEYPFNPQGGYTELGFPIGDQFKKVTTGGISASLYDPATTLLSWNQESTDETGMYVADGAVGWFRMGIVNPPESGFCWNPRAAIAGGTSAVQSVETTAGNCQLLIGPASGTGPILCRDDSGTVYTDNTVTYPAWDIKGVNLLCSTGQWAEVAHISAKSSAVGMRPAVSYLMGEIKVIAARPLTRLNLAAKSEDPPLLRPSLTAYSDRYVLAQNGVDNCGDCILTKFDYGSQNQPDELLDWGIFASIHDERAEQAEAAK